MHRFKAVTPTEIPLQADELIAAGLVSSPAAV
jgi:hypothetical protein